MLPIVIGPFDLALVRALLILKGDCYCIGSLLTKTIFNSGKALIGPINLRTLQLAYDCSDEALSRNLPQVVAGVGKLRHDVRPGYSISIWT